LPSKPESNPREHCNCVTLKEEVEEPEDILLEEGREVIMAESKERNDGGKRISLLHCNTRALAVVVVVLLTG